MTKIAAFRRVKDERAWHDEPFDGRAISDPRWVFAARPSDRECAEPFWAVTAARRARFQALLDEVARNGA